MTETDQLETDIFFTDEEAYQFHYQKQTQDRLTLCGGNNE